MNTELAPAPARYRGRPRYEGANIRTWIGFKHFMYLAEDAVLAHLRADGFGANRLYLEHGLGISVVDSRGQLPNTLFIDDEVVTTLTPLGTDPGAFAVQLVADRPDGPVTVYHGRIRIAAVREPMAPGSAPAPPGLALPPVPGVGEGGEVLAQLPGPAGSFRWSWRIPYFYCQFSHRLAHSGYVRALEEVVDRCLADRGLAIGALLAERSWIPVVSRARVQLLQDAYIEETLHTVFSVQEILKDTLFTARMDCYVERDGGFHHTATASILHGYAISRGPQAGTLATLDPQTQRALLGVDR